MRWSTERVELLRKLWLEGLTAAQVAAELGAGVTRNAVIGKVTRLGIAERRNGAKAGGFRRHIPRAVPPAPAHIDALDRRHAASSAPKAPLGRQTPLHEGEAHSPVPIAPTPIDEEVFAPVSTRVALIDLKPHHCRWPIGDAREENFGFCGGHGANIAAGRPYCPRHEEIAYRRGSQAEMVAMAQRAAHARAAKKGGSAR